MVLKRKFSIFITMLVCLFALVGLTSCGTSGAEKKVANFIIEEMIESYKDPSSVIVTSPSISKDGCVAKCKIGGKNSYGSLNYTTYYLVLESFTTDGGNSFEAGEIYEEDWDDPTYGMMYLVAHLKENEQSLDAEKINKIISKWKKSNGYIQ